MNKLTIILSLCALLCPIFGVSQWPECADAEFTGNSVYDLEVIDENLFITGGFSEINGENLNGLAHWDGTSWGDVPSTSGGLTIVQYGDSLVVGGSFNDQGGVQGCNAIAAFHEEQWHTMGGGIQAPAGDIKGMAIDLNNCLIVVGAFSELGGIEPIQRVAKWDGTQWEDIGGFQGFVGEPETATVFNGDVFVGGAFAFADQDVPSPNLARWDGEQWIAVETGTNGTVKEIYPSEEHGFMYIGGLFSDAAGETAMGIAKFDGTNTSAIAEIGFNNAARSICVYRDQIYAAGAFTELSNGQPMNSIARFDGVSWQPVGGGIGGSVFDMEVYQDELYVAGGLQWAGNESNQVSGVVRWYLHPDSVTWGVPDLIPDFDQKIDQLLVYPNPAEKGQITLESEHSYDLLLIFDQRGTLVVREKRSPSDRYDIADLASGTYQLITVAQGTYVGQTQLVVR